MTDQTKGGEKKSSGLGAILLTVFIDLVGFSIIFPLFPEMLVHYVGLEGPDSLIGQLQQHLVAFAPAGGDREFYAVVLFGGVLGSVYSLLTFVAAPLWGSLSDRIGRRRVLLVTVTGTLLSYALWFFAGTFSLLLLARVLGGVMSGNLSVATAAVADVTEEKDRAKGLGMLGAAFGVGFIIGPTLGGVLSLVRLEDLVGLPGVNPFSGAALGALLLSALNLVWIWRRFPETLSVKHRAGRPVSPLRLFAPTDVSGVNRTNLVYFIFITAFAGMEFTLTFLCRDRFDYSSLQNGLLFIFVGVIAAAVQGGVVRKLVPRIGEVKTARIGVVLTVPGLLAIGVAGSQAMLYVGLFLISVGSSLATPSLTALVSLYAPDDRQGELLGVFRSLGSLGRGVAPLIAAGLYWKFGSGSPYTVSALVLLLPLALTWALPERSAAAAEI